MGDRGNCKIFAPNYFNPTKCQNCFKQKEHHSTQEAPASGKPTGKPGPGARNVLQPKPLLKESVLLKASMGRDNVMPETWDRRWFALYSNGELQEYAIVDGQINKDNVTSSVMLQDFIRMLDGKVELGEKLCFGIKTLRETIYFKTTTKVDYENWWKEISTFVASPLKRTASASVNNAKSNLGGLNRPTLCKQLSVPISTISPARSSRSSSISSLQSEPEHPAMEGLRTQISKLEDENSKLTKAEEERRKLELEVNYWKEYVTNAQLVKKSGGSTDTVTELADARRRLIQLQDELNQTQKKLKSNTGKLLMRNKEVADCKEKLREAHSIIAVYKAKIEQLTKEISSKNEIIDDACADEPVVKREEPKGERRKSDGEPLVVFDTSRVVSPDAQHLEDKFLLLKDKLKRIERELLIKSKELEKANESRSKVAKYTRSLLQELETRLRDNQQKLGDTEDKLKNVNIELGMERERRMKLEEGPRRRMSNIVSPPKPTFHVDTYTNVTGNCNPAADLTEHDVDTKYADYYRSRFKEAESSLLEKDKKLHQAEEKIKEIQSSMKHNSDTYKVINEMQIKLSDATHKLSDRQLKIHELTCEVDRLRKFEKTYGKKRQQCGTLEDIVKDLETQNSELSKNLFHVRQELEMLKIREVVLKEQLQTFADDSEESDSDDDTKLGKSVDLKKKIENMIDLESRCKKYSIDNEDLSKKNAELETRLRNLNMVNFKNLESNKDFPSETSNTNDQNEKRIKELEQTLATEEERFCNQLTSVKEQYMNEISTLEKKSEKDLSSAKDELAKAKLEIENLSLSKQELESRIQELNAKILSSETKVLEEKTKEEVHDERTCEAEELMDEERILITSQEESTTEKDNTDGSMKDRDSGIVITQEIKSMIDAAKSNNVDMLPCNSDSSFSIPHDSVSEIDIIEKYKLVCSKFQIKMKELTAKYMQSEEKCIELAQTLEKNNSSEQTIVLEYDILLGRVDELESQIVESQDLLQSKADELEKERKNVIHLVEVTSAYIKELEDSLEESKSKINELQSNKKDDSKTSKCTDEPVIKSDELQDESVENEEVVAIRQKLTAKILTLQSDISELTENHAKEMETVKSAAQKEIDDLKNELSEHDDRIDEEDLKLKVLSLEQALKEQNESYAAEVEMLNQHFQAELKQAFCGDNAGIDMLTRMQELEMEVDTVRKNCDNKIKQLQDAHEKEKTQIKEDMATVLQASMSSMSFGGEYHDDYESGNADVEDLEERVCKLQQELEEMEEKYKNDLECEKRAHQSEMEDTIRDMMMVRNATTRYDDVDVEDSATKASGDEKTPPSLQSTISLEEHENLKAAHEEVLEKLKEEHDEEVAQVRSDFTLVISSLRQGSSSDAIIDLHGKINTSDKDLEERKKSHEKELADIELKVKRLESQNFFAVRRNEEMGGKIYHMQIELEEMERKHQMEIASYQDQLGYVDGSEDDSVHHCLKENCDLRDKMRSLESELEELRNEHEQKIETIIMQLQEEKRAEIEDMTDKVIKLESLINEMKENHLRDLKALEKLDREEELEAVQIEKERIKELETMNETLKVEYEEEIEELAKEHKKEVEKLRVFYEKEMGDMKKKLASEDPASRKASVDHNALIKQAVKEQKDIHERELNKLKADFCIEKEAIDQRHQSDINDIRVQYDEKLKMGYKEGLRRQSMSERKSDGTRMRQLISEKDAIQTKLLEQEIKYDTDVTAKDEKINELERLLENAKVNPQNINSNDTNTNSSTINSNAEDEMQKKIKEHQEQIERFQRRIEYYRDKATREKTEESHRVDELQSNILELRREIENLVEGKKKKETEKENPEKEPTVKMSSRKSVEGAPLRRYTDSVTVKFGRKREIDPRKRWSNLEETSEKDDGKGGSVLARKTLWENKSVEDSKYAG